MPSSLLSCSSSISISAEVDTGCDLPRCSWEMCHTLVGLPGLVSATPGSLGESHWHRWDSGLRRAMAGRWCQMPVSAWSFVLGSVIMRRRHSWTVAWIWFLKNDRAKDTSQSYSALKSGFQFTIRNNSGAPVVSTCPVGQSFWTIGHWPQLGLHSFLLSLPLQPFHPHLFLGALMTTVDEL